jgi:hypothetical protein
MTQTIWANGYKPPPPLGHTAHGYDKYAATPVVREPTKFRQLEAYELFKRFPAMCASQLAELLKMENSAACHLLGKMDRLRWTMEHVQGSTHKKRVYRSRE